MSSDGCSFITVAIELNGVSVPVRLDDEALRTIAAAIEATREPEPASPWLTIPAVANYLGRSEAAARKFIDRNHIDKHQEIKGGTVTIRRADLDAYLNSNRRRSR